MTATPSAYEYWLTLAPARWACPRCGERTEGMIYRHYDQDSMCQDCAVLVDADFRESRKWRASHPQRHVAPIGPAVCEARSRTEAGRGEWYAFRPPGQDWQLARFPAARRRAKRRSTSGLTHADIDAAKTPKGGWTRAQLGAWGVPWPPAKGWKKRLVEGR